MAERLFPHLDIFTIGVIAMMAIVLVIVLDIERQNEDILNTITTCRDQVELVNQINARLEYIREQCDCEIEDIETTCID